MSSPSPTTSGHDPFVFTVADRSGAVEGAFHIANANDISGSILVPAVDPLFAWLIAFAPYLAPLFTQLQSLGYTAAPVLELFDASNNLLAESVCTPIGGTRTCQTVYTSQTGQPGTPSATDPLIDYKFTQAGTYKLEVAANVVWSPFTSAGIFSVPNTFRQSGIQQLQSGMDYQLYVSLQGHNTNPNQFTFVGDQVTIAAAPAPARPRRSRATTPRASCSRCPATASASTARAASCSPTARAASRSRRTWRNDTAYQQQVAKAPSSDSYQVVLTSPLTGNETVTIDVTPAADADLQLRCSLRPERELRPEQLRAGLRRTPQARFPWRARRSRARRGRS